MPPKRRGGGGGGGAQSQEAPALTASQEQYQRAMTKIQTIYQSSQIEQEIAAPNPIEVLFSAAPMILIGTFSISAFCRWWFKESKPISKQKLLEILTQAYQTWGYTLTESSKQEQNIMQQHPEFSPEEKKQVTDYLRYQAMQQLGQAEEQLLQGAGASREQVQEAIKIYEGDKQVAKLTADLNKIVSTIVPPPPLPYPWTENDVIALLSELFELRISSMEESYKALQLHERPKGIPMTPQMAEDLNQLFNETLQRRLDKFYSDKKITAQYLQKLIRSISSSNNYIDLVHTYKGEQQQRYAALGLEVKKR